MRARLKDDFRKPAGFAHPLRLRLDRTYLTNSFQISQIRLTNQIHDDQFNLTAKFESTLSGIDFTVVKRPLVFVRAPTSPSPHRMLVYHGLGLD